MRPSPKPKPYCSYDFSQISQAVFRSDIDKTYLETEFESLRQLVKIPFESAKDKISIAGAAALFRVLRHGPDGKTNPILFITSSPPEIGKAIEGKLKIDGVEFDDIKYKDQLQNLRKREFNKVRDHISYKLSRLLWGRYFFPEGTSEFLFGDDSEQDPWIYSLYADLLQGLVSTRDLEIILKFWGLAPAEHESVMTLYSLLENRPKASCVPKIFINLATGTDPAYYRRYGSRLVPIKKYGWAAVSLVAEGILSPDQLKKFLTLSPEQSVTRDELIHLGQYWTDEQRQYVLDILTSLGFSTFSFEGLWKTRPNFIERRNINTYMQKFT